jgi:hypothetical protein
MKGHLKDCCRVDEADARQDKCVRHRRVLVDGRKHACLLCCNACLITVSVTTMSPVQHQPGLLAAVLLLVYLAVKGHFKNDCCRAGEADAGQDLCVRHPQ